MMKTPQTNFFDGSTYVPEIDHARLADALKAVWFVMRDCNWHTIGEIREQAEIWYGKPMSEAGCSARIRDIRKEKFQDLLPDGYEVTVERRRRGPASAGVFEYRVVSRWS